MNVISQWPEVRIRRSDSAARRKHSPNPRTIHYLRPIQRRGVALMAAVVTLAILSLMISATAWQILANRRMLHHRRYELQSAWLARSGVERARARLLATPTGYDGETVEMIPLSRVRIEVKPEQDSPDTFLIASEARYPTDATDVVVRSVSRRFKRQVDGKVVTLELLPGGE